MNHKVSYMEGKSSLKKTSGLRLQGGAGGGGVQKTNRG